MNRLERARQELAAAKQTAADLLDKIEAAEADDEDTTALEAMWDEAEAAVKAAEAGVKSAERAEARRTAMALAPSGIQVGVDRRTLDPQGGFADIAEFARAVHAACRAGGVVDGRLQRNAAPSNYYTGGGSSNEGFLLPTEFRDRIFELMFEADALMNLVDTEPTVNRSIEWLADEATPWGSNNMTAAWRAEGAQMTASKASLSKKTITLDELYTMGIATEEMLADAPRLQARITQKAATAMIWKIDAAIVEGTGAGMPLGWMNSSCLVTVPKESGQAAASIVPENLVKMLSRLHRFPGDSPFWMINPDVFPQIATLKFGDNLVWTPTNSGFKGAPNGLLLGLPLRFSEHCETLGTAGDIQLISPKGYYALRRTDGPQYASSIHLFFDYGMEVFRWTYRFGGQPHLSAPITPKKGSATRSPFIALATRA